MSTTPSEVMARLRLVQGSSASRVRDFARSDGGLTVLTVGADPRCDWCIQEANVAPVHFSLHWDGSHMAIADTHGAGGVLVDGERLGAAWRRVGVRARIEFGRAAIVAECNASSAKRAADASGSVVRFSKTLQSVGSPLQVEERQLSEVDRRHTVEGYVVRAAGSANVNDSSAPAAPQVRPSGTVTTLAPRRGGSLPALRDPAGAYFDMAGRIPGQVTVIRPGDSVGSDDTVVDATQGFRLQPPDKPLARWSSVVLSLVSIVVGYVSWIYLLHVL